MDLLNYNKLLTGSSFLEQILWEGIFFHDLVWRKNLDPDRWISHSYFYFLLQW